MTGPDTACIGGMPVVALRPAQHGAAKPEFDVVWLAPGRAMMLLQATARMARGDLVDVMASPPAARIQEILSGGPEDAQGVGAFALGGAILAPFANRIRGRPCAEQGYIQTSIAGRDRRLPANWTDGGEPCAIHGLMLDRGADEFEADSDRAHAKIRAGDFGGCWPSSTELTIDWRVSPQMLSLNLQALNVGAESLPIGLGWHPCLAIPSGQRAQASVCVPARRRLIRDDETLFPTGELSDVEGTVYDLKEGRELGGQFFDDAFVDLVREPSGEVVCSLVDPAARYGVRIVAASDRVSAVQLYAPLDRPSVAIEPQFNWTDPYGAQWGAHAATGMALLEPGEVASYSVRMELFEP